MEKIDHILLVDDNAVTNFFNKDLIDSMDLALNVTILSTNDEVLSFFRANIERLRNEKALMFLDIRMPDQDGFELFRELDDLELLPEDGLRICMLTSSNLKRDREQWQKFPMITAFLEKPLDADKINSVLDRSSQDR